MKRERPPSSPALPAQPVVTVADAVRIGLSADRKWLPPWLLYDARGSALYERITALDAYYPMRAEREILEREAASFVEAVSAGDASALKVVELGAGSAAKTEAVLAAAVDALGGCVYAPIDVSASAIESARVRITSRFPGVSFQPVISLHEKAFPAIRALGPRRLVLFIGSSVGNMADDEAVRMLGQLRENLDAEDALLLGTDLRKDPAILLLAYDDPEGVTAAFNLNLLQRINRELGAHFDLARFRHVARWNDEASRIEMHLESLEAQRVRIDALDCSFAFGAGETIHTESSIKYDLPRVQRMLKRAGYHPERSAFDVKKRFAVHLARVPSTP